MRSSAARARFGVGKTQALRVATVVALAVVGTGCGSTSRTATSGTSAATPASTGSQPSAANASALPGVHEYGLNDAQFVDYIQRSQAAIADCMHQGGFEYVPVDVKTVEDAQKRVRSDPGYTRRSYKQKWGLGVTTRFDDPVRDIGLGPNLRIWQGLPQADREAYARTLFGETTHHQDFVWLLDEERLYEAAGCTRTGVAKVFPAAMLKDSFVNPKDELINSDKRIIAARANWSKCMKAKGYDYKEDQDEIIDEYTQRLDDLTQGQDPTTLTGSKLARLKKLQQEEIAVSLADVDCEIQYCDSVYRTVEIEVYGRPVSG
jgi:hypothetical protein